MKIVRTISAAVMLAAAATAVAGTPKVIAHRGYWETEGSAQNSIRSLFKADSIGCYASEFDIWMTKDSVVVLNHDPSINGIVIEKAFQEGGKIIRDMGIRVESLARIQDMTEEGGIVFCD